MSAIHQFVAGFTNGDAISNEAMVFRDLFRSWGFQSEIFSQHEHILPSLRGEVLDADKYLALSQKDDTALLHLSCGSPVNDIFRALPCRKAVMYHNITPPHYFDMVNKTTAELLRTGLEQVKSLAGIADLNMAVSRFDAQDLESKGYSDVKVLPLMIDFSRFETPPDAIMEHKLAGRTNVIFVGRCVPNKKIEDLLKAFHYFKTIQPGAHLIHVGSFAGAEPYWLSLKRMARELRIADSVTFLGAVTLSELNAVYRSADIFLCMSEHEGFCIPLLESMYFNVPVMAYAAAAVPETLANSGILFTEKNYPKIAEMMNQLTTNNQLKTTIQKTQQTRLSEYQNLDLGSQLKTILIF